VALKRHQNIHVSGFQILIVRYGDRKATQISEAGMNKMMG
jgi:hypothetical protein